MKDLVYYNDLQSKTISFLRFYLMIGVVFIHIFPDTIFESMNLIPSQKPIFYYTTRLFSFILPKVSVPLFFFISGFLFFYNIKFTKYIYLKKLTSRIKTIFIPYMIWITFFLSLYIFIQNFLQYSIFTPNNYLKNILLDFSFTDYLHAYGVGEIYPFVGQFWFIRNLIVFIIITPFLFFIIKKLKYFYLLLIGIMWFFNCFPKYNYEVLNPLFFFSLGCYYSIYKKNIIIEFKNLFHISIFLYTAFIIFSIFTIYKSFGLYIINLSILSGIIFFFSIVSIMIEKKYIKINIFLLSSTFFLFATHSHLTIFIKKVFLRFIKYDNDIFLTISYFILVIITVFISLILYYFLNKFFPKFSNLITGGRNLK